MSWLRQVRRSITREIIAKEVITTHAVIFTMKAAAEHRSAPRTMTRRVCLAWVPRNVAEGRIN